MLVVASNASLELSVAETLEVELVEMLFGEPKSSTDGLLVVGRVDTAAVTPGDEAPGEALEDGMADDSWAIESISNEE